VYSLISGHNLFKEKIEMKSYRGFILGLVLGLATAFATLGMAQNATQTDANKTKESCCAMASCCCCGGDSCAMKDGSQNKSGKHEGCCCGDSCDTKDMKGMKDMKNKPQ